MGDLGPEHCLCIVSGFLDNEDLSFSLPGDVKRPLPIPRAAQIIFWSFLAVLKTASGFPFIENKKDSWFLVFVVSWFLGFRDYRGLGFLVSKFLVSWLRSFKDQSLLRSVSSVFSISGCRF